ncbi:hypothetical protein C84B14_13599 [Salinisphaera sp. C84B14]|uniref:hypothetical protein n=1 Tax=Salinisphaera sp. C84B14 TaxID=1304155 RepID=UPI00333EE5DA
MKKYEYRDYDDYYDAQVSANRKKIDKVWAVEGVIKQLAGYLESQIENIRFGICHGTRNGREQLWFREALSANVVGTEISPTASSFAHTIEWDFHNVKPEWVGNVDFIFSNSLDHSYDPEYCLDQWMSCLGRDGLCLIEWTEDDVENKRSDPFGANLEEYRSLIGGKYRLIDELFFDAEYIRESFLNDTNREGLNFFVDRYYLVVAN